MIAAVMKVYHMNFVMPFKKSNIKYKISIDTHERSTLLLMYHI